MTGTVEGVGKTIVIWEDGEIHCDVLVELRIEDARALLEKHHSKVGGPTGPFWSPRDNCAHAVFWLLHDCIFEKIESVGGDVPQLPPVPHGVIV
jgi:hypothetical protein